MIKIPVVEIKMWIGRDDTVKEKIVKGITDVFVSLGTPENAVTIILTEYPKSNWAHGGKLASAR